MRTNPESCKRKKVNKLGADHLKTAIISNPITFSGK